MYLLQFCQITKQELGSNSYRSQRNNSWRNLRRNWLRMNEVLLRIPVEAVEVGTLHILARQKCEKSSIVFVIAKFQSLSVQASFSVNT